MPDTPATRRTGPERRTALLLCLLLFALAAAVYLPTLWHDFVDFDDTVHVSRNPHVNTGLTSENLRHAFLVGGPDYWHPLSTLSLMLDAEIFGLKAGGFHATNLLLHACNSVLLFLAFRRMSGKIWSSAFIGALFAAHPMHVEAVAWVTARKDVLALSFGLLTLLAYAHHAERPSVKRFLPVFLLLALGLMAKPLLITLPCALLLLDFWPLGRTPWWSRPDGPVFAKATPGRLVLEKLPLFALILASSILTLTSHPKAPEHSIEHPLPLLLANAAVSYPRYLWKLVWPTDIAPLLPLPQSVPVWQWAGSLLLLAGISALVVRQAKSRPHLLVGWLWFLGAMLPMLKLHGLGLWYSIATRFTYLPYIGLYAALAFGLPELTARLRIPAKALAAAACLTVAVLAVDARGQVDHWENSLRLFQHNVNVSRDNFQMQTNLANALLQAGRGSEALSAYREATRIEPREAVGWSNLGYALIELGRPLEAVPLLRAALRLDPAHVDAYVNLGAALYLLDKPAEALDLFDEALRRNPSFPMAAYNRGRALLDLNRPAEAAEAFEQTLRIDPDNPRARQALAEARQKAAAAPAKP
jgi:tetratricopeptide (TPR) repeat protein